jgi:hypothetical protein
VRNLMDTGIQLGRRFRSLEAVDGDARLRAEGMRAVYREHLRLARLFASWVDADPASNAWRRCRSAWWASGCAVRPASHRQVTRERAADGARECQRRDLPLAHAARRRFVIQLAIGITARANSTSPARGR